jgi:hypothetical protein
MRTCTYVLFSAGGRLSLVGRISNLLRHIPASMPNATSQIADRPASAGLVLYSLVKEPRRKKKRAPTIGRCCTNFAKKTVSRDGPNRITLCAERNKKICNVTGICP